MPHAIVEDHWYVVADCKSTYCKSIHVLKYLGPVKANPGPGAFLLEVEDPIRLRCPQCGQVHDYKHQRDLRLDKLPTPPPPDFEDKTLPFLLDPSKRPRSTN